MKALSLTEPWARLVVAGEKEFETRSWRTSYRGRIAIHAAKKYPKWARELAEGDRHFFNAITRHPPRTMQLGVIVGTAEIMGMWSTDDLKEYLDERGDSKEIAFGDYDSERWGWELAEPDMLREPIPCRGALGLWEVPPDVLGQITIDSIERMLFL